MASCPQHPNAHLIREDGRQLCAQCGLIVEARSQLINEVDVPGTAGAAANSVGSRVQHVHTDLTKVRQEGLQKLKDLVDSLGLAGVKEPAVAMCVSVWCASSRRHDARAPHPAVAQRRCAPSRGCSAGVHTAGRVSPVHLPCTHRPSKLRQQCGLCSCGRVVGQLYRYLALPVAIAGTSSWRAPWYPTRRHPRTSIPPAPTQTIRSRRSRLGAPLWCNGAEVTALCAYAPLRPVGAAGLCTSSQSQEK